MKKKDLLKRLREAPIDYDGSERMSSDICRNFPINQCTNLRSYVQTRKSERTFLWCASNRQSGQACVLS